MKQLSIAPMTREIDVNEITIAVSEMSIEANTVASCDLRDALKSSMTKEESPVGKAVIKQLLDNPTRAKEIGKKGREVAKEKFNYKEIAKKVISLVENKK